MSSGTEKDSMDMRATERLRQHTGTMAEDFRQLGRLTKEAAGEYYEQGRDKAGELGQQVEGYVRQKPVTALLIAAGAGLVLGYLLSRRS